MRCTALSNHPRISLFFRLAKSGRFCSRQIRKREIKALCLLLLSSFFCFNPFSLPTGNAPQAGQTWSKHENIKVMEILLHTVGIFTLASKVDTYSALCETVKYLSVLYWKVLTFKAFKCTGHWCIPAAMNNRTSGMIPLVHVCGLVRPLLCWSFFLALEEENPRKVKQSFRHSKTLAERKSQAFEF